MFTHLKTYQYGAIDQQAINSSLNDAFDTFGQNNGGFSFDSFDQFGADTFDWRPSPVGMGASFAPSQTFASGASSFFPSVSTESVSSPSASASNSVSSIGGSAQMVSASSLTSAASAASGSSAGGSSVFVSTSGSGLVFDNTYGASCTAQYEACIVAAEDQLESLFTNSDTIVVTFNESNEGNNGLALGNGWNGHLYSYSTLKAALLKVAPSDVLPSTDPSGGVQWNIPDAYARMLGLSTTTGSPDDSITLNTFYPKDFGQDVINGLTHELSEGGMGRVGGLGGNGTGHWSTMDLFRYNAAGQPDYTNGRDGDTTYYSANGGATLSNQDLPNEGEPTLSYHNNYNASNTNVSKGDNDDWVQENVFGATGKGETVALTQTELDVMESLGWHLSLKQDVDATSGSWETPADWSTGSMPIEAQDAYINATEVALDSKVIVNSIATSAGSVLAIGDSAASKLTAVDGTVLNTEDTSSVASGNLGDIFVYTGSALQIGFVSETFDNAGSVTLGKGAGGSGVGYLDIAGSVTLNGGGTVTLGQTGTDGDIVNAPGTSGDRLVNVNNTLSGSGLMSLGSFDNQSGGDVKAQSSLRISAATFTNEGTITDEASATLDLGQDGTTQSLNDTGSVDVDGGADLAISGKYTVTGSGAIVFKGAGAEISSDGKPATFSNVSTIDAVSSGQIGDGDLTFDNSGTVAASLSGVTLTINTGDNTVLNTGTFEAGNSATLAIVSNVTNKGTMEAGTPTSSGTLDLGQDGGTGSTTNTGVIAIYGDSDLAISGAYTVAGSGDIGLKGAGADITSDGNAPATFTNASAIEALASGQIGDVGIKASNDLAFINTSSVLASGSGVTLTLNTGANTINDGGGLLAAESGATLAIDSNVNTGQAASGSPPGGTIEAGPGGTVILSAKVADGVSGSSVPGKVVVDGGTLEILAGSSISVPILASGTGDTITGMGFTVTAESGTILTLGGNGLTAVKDVVDVSAAAVGGDVLTGGGVTDTLVLTSAGSVNLGGVSKFGTIDLAAGNNTVTVTDKTLSGGAVALHDGASGNDSVSAAGDTAASKGKTLTYFAGTGTDSFTGGFENDTVRVSAAAVTGDVLTGGSGTDTLVLTSAGSVSLGGVSKFTTIDLATGNSTVTVTDKTLSGGAVALHDGASGKNSVSTAGDTAASQGKTLTYFAGTGTDSFTGGFESDTVRVSAAAVAGDAMNGGSGTNTLVLTSAGSVNLGGVNKFGTIDLAAGNSTVTVTDKTLSGGAVTLRDGASGNDTVSAVGDTSASTGKTLTYEAGPGTGSFTGGFENDTIYVGTGLGTYTAGSGSDTLVFIKSNLPSQTLNHFQPGLDDLLVYGIHASNGFDLGSMDNGLNPPTPTAIDPSIFVASVSGAFTSSTQRFAYDTTNGQLHYSATGSNSSESLVAMLSGEPGITASNLRFEH